MSPRDSERPDPGRRAFLAGAAAASAAVGLEGVLAARRPPAFAQGTKLHLLRWVDFIPACDVVLKQEILPAASKALGAEVQLETINGNDLQPRITAAIQSGGGPDIIQMLHNWPHLYQAALADVTDLGEWQGKDQGGYYAQAEAAAKDGKRWLALPHGIVGLQIAYRKSWLAEVGATAFPKTLEDLRQVGMKLKKKGHPYGQTLGHTFGDAPAWSYPLIWAYGAAEVDQTGRKVVLDSKGAVEAVKFMQAFWKDACDEGGLAWDDTTNNRAFLAGEISATLNGASIYIAAKRGQDKIKDEKGEPMVRDIEHAPLPAGPSGVWGYHVAFSHAVMKYGKNQKLAKDFLKWLHGKEQFGKWFEVAEGFSVGSTKYWEQHPLWTKVDEPMKIYRQAAGASRMIGYAGPPSAKATEVYSKYIITDMFAKAVQGTSAEDSVKWAAGELRKIYG
ncbi:MAG TPA: extracellular solute-binding protein [Methylomirabilota bacterium]|nr:extracellular solute-binding protein [Methylomirabilota bacterium]